MIDTQSATSDDWINGQVVGVLYGTTGELRLLDEWGYDVLLLDTIGADDIAIGVDEMESGKGRRARDVLNEMRRRHFSRCAETP